MQNSSVVQRRLEALQRHLPGSSPSVEQQLERMTTSSGLGSSIWQDIPQVCIASNLYFSQYRSAVLVLGPKLTFRNLVV